MDTETTHLPLSLSLSLSSLYHLGIQFSRPQGEVSARCQEMKQLDKASKLHHSLKRTGEASYGSPLHNNSPLLAA
ncbi:hypothetical protein E2C01_102173 [Portunus trituberculatus]|uniref:Uncharacterized protein n=1 Tax=Portunus trituberculatus TaxID=210409 RepID=A0A5B7KNL2_PORTR|nr:hypothetical protein [Portunus trituberculatus]